MKTCKRDGCREEAVGVNERTYGFKRKQYCKTHYAEYLEKQKSAARRYAEMPTCEGTWLRCECKVKVKEEGTLCKDCQNAEDEYNSDRLVRYQWDKIDNIEDLKDFLISQNIVNLP